MIIKIIPETDVEKMRMQEVEHTGVKEFFIFGSKKDADADLLDFHDWSGSYRYLVGSLYYFTKHLSDEQESKGSKGANQPVEVNIQAPAQLPFPPQVIPSELEKDAEGQNGLVKKSNAQDGEIEGVVEVAEVPNITAFPGQNQSKSKKDIPAETEMTVEEDVPNDNSKTADDEPF